MTQITTLNTVRQSLGVADDDHSQDDLIGRLIGVATKYVERYTRRQLSTGVALRLFDGNDRGKLQVDDFIECTGVELTYFNNIVWKTFNVATELMFQPYNRVPHHTIVINNLSSENPYRVIGRSPYIFPKGYGNVRVMANWGSYTFVPPDLESVGVALVTARLAKSKTDGLTSASIGGESVSFSDKDLEAGQREILELHKRQWTEVW